MERDLFVELHETPLPWVIKEPNLESNWCRDDKRTAKSFLSVMPRRVQEGIKLRSAPNRFQGWKGRKANVPAIRTPQFHQDQWVQILKILENQHRRNHYQELWVSLFRGSMLLSWHLVHPWHHFCSHPFSHPISRPRWTQPDLSLGFTPPIVVANHNMIPRGVPFWHFLA